MTSKYPAQKIRFVKKLIFQSFRRCDYNRKCTINLMKTRPILQKTIIITIQWGATNNIIINRKKNNKKIFRHNKTGIKIRECIFFLISFFLFALKRFRHSYRTIIIAVQHFVFLNYFISNIRRCSSHFNRILIVFLFFNLQLVHLLRFMSFHFICNAKFESHPFGS